MREKIIKKIGYYTISEINNNGTKKYKADSGKTLYLHKIKKIISNPYRDLKYSDNINDIIEYVNRKLETRKREKDESTKNSLKFLYLVLIKEKETNKIFVKIGFTSKKYINRRFSKKYGYDGYVLESIIRKVKTPNAEKIEEKIKNKLNKKKFIRKYRPILESFSGYSECYEFANLKEIINIFDSITNHN